MKLTNIVANELADQLAKKHNEQRHAKIKKAKSSPKLTAEAKKWSGILNKLPKKLDVRIGHFGSVTIENIKNMLVDDDRVGGRRMGGYDFRGHVHVAAADCKSMAELKSKLGLK